MQSDATTVEEYLDGLDNDRRAQIEPVYRLVHDAMPAGYTESVDWGMISWSVPLESFPDTYNGKPLSYVCLAAQKRHNALYLMGLYSDSQEAEEFRARWTADGRRLDMGKSCLRFKDPAEINEDLIAETVAGMTPDRLIALHERARAERPVRPQAKRR
jgi:Domain of unknown function (DU1801)